MWRLAKLTVICTICIWNANGGAIGSSQTRKGHAINVRSYDSTGITWRLFLTESWLLSNVRLNADPCNNFYDFTCGMFGKTYPELVDFNRDLYAKTKDEIERRMRYVIETIDEKTSPKHFKIMKILYDSCMNTDEAERSRTQLSTWYANVRGPNGWPVVAGDKWNSIRNRKKVLAGLIKVRLYLDTVNRRSLIPWIEPKHQVLDRAVLRMGFNNEIVQAYYNCMVDVAVIFGASEVAARNELKDAVLAEIEMANDTSTESVRWNTAIDYDRTTFGKFATKYPLMRAIITSNIPKNYGLGDNDTIMVSKSFAHIAAVSLRTPTKTLANLLRWYRIYAKVGISPELRNRTSQLKNLIQGFHKPTKKWQKCVGLVHSKLDLSFSALYQRTFISAEVMSGVSDMVTLIRQKIREIVNESDWLDATSKMEIVNKIDGTVGHVGFRDEYRDNEKLVDYYKKLELSPGDLKANLRNIENFLKNIDNGQARYVPNRDDWTVEGDTLSLEASYDRWFNTYKVPAVYVMGYYYNINRPMFLNFAMLGSIIAHEMAHALDLTSISLDAKANSSGTLSSESKREFDKRVQCVIEQYGNYTVDEVGLQLRAYRTLDENLADNLGVEAAYRAYLEWADLHDTEWTFEGLNYTPQQLFWISIGSSLCKNYEKLELMNVVLSNDRVPVKYRVNGVVANRPEFANDFECETGSEMNPVQKCRVW